MTTKNIFYTIVTVLVVCVAVDITGFCFWALSGQTPPDDFFVGAETRSILTHFSK